MRSFRVHTEQKYKNKYIENKYIENKVIENKFIPGRKMKFISFTFQ